MDEKERLAIARQMVDGQITFFPVPLGTQLDPRTLHGLAATLPPAALASSAPASMKRCWSMP